MAIYKLISSLALSAPSSQAFIYIIFSLWSDIYGIYGGEENRMAKIYAGGCISKFE